MRAGEFGLVIGRFLPPHLGHRHLVTEACRRADRVAVLVMARASEPIPGELRVAWLAAMCPRADVRLVRHDLPTDFSDQALWERWMALMRDHLGRDPDVVFTSEGYGSELARRFGAREVCVDPDRSTVPISATRIRQDPLGHLEFLPEPAAAWFVAHAEEWSAPT